MKSIPVVNSFQKFCIFAVANNASPADGDYYAVVNSFQKFCIFAVANNNRRK